MGKDAVGHGFLMHYQYMPRSDEETPWQNSDTIEGISFHWLYSPLEPWPLIILQTVGLLGRVISSSQGLYLNTEKLKHRINTYTYKTSMPWVGFEPMIPASERAKTVYVLDRSATVTGTVEGIRE
jgi:hypothetical protein